MWTHANYLSLSLHHHPACGRGFYKSSSQDLQCSRCPAHSYNDREGSWRCDCEDGYYRALSDPPSVACTSEWAVCQSLVFFLSYPSLLYMSLYPQKLTCLIPNSKQLSVSCQIKFELPEATGTSVFWGALWHSWLTWCQRQSKERKF